MRKLGNEENDEKDPFARRGRNRDESNAVLKIFNAQNKEITFF
jgi:hypothetical protein